MTPNPNQLEAMPPYQWRAMHKGKAHVIKPGTMKLSTGTYKYLCCLKCKAVYLLSFKEKEK